MVSISNMTQSQASKYYEKDQNYYQDDESSKLSSWQGKGAEALGLVGSVDNEIFNRLQSGIHPFEDKILVDTTKRAGTDLTFSAPKSLSILAELSDKELDLKIREAQNLAVQKTIDFVEKFAQTREQKNNERKTIDTNNLVVAKFNHDVSRELDPQLHTHCFIVNMTQKESGEWRALHNDKLFKNKMLFGQIYRNELAKEIKKLGYEIEITNAKMGLWELKDFNQELLKEFSTRRAQVEKRFIELKAKFPNLSDAKLKEMATLDSRKAKDKKADRKKIKEININRAKKIVGQELNAFSQSVTHLSQNEKTELSKEQVVKIASEILTSKESLFTKEQLLQESLKLSINSYTLEDIEEAIANDKELVNFEKNIYSTKEMIKIEKEIVEKIKNARELNPIAYKDEAQKFIDNNFSTFTQGQKEAFLHIATSKDNLVAIQGDAGSGKTYMLKALKEFKGDNLIGLAFTGKAAEQLENESGIKSNTLHSFLNQKEHKSNQIYIVDEASMIGSRQMHKLINLAEKTNSKIVLIGDTKQFQTIQAGSIFLELQRRDLIKTAYMSENLRAKTELLKEIYQNIKNKDIKKAFTNIESNNLIKETSNLQEIAKEYLKDKDDTLLIASKNKDRKELNQIIRDELKSSLTNHQNLTIRENTALDDVERHYATNYQKEQIVFVNQSVPSLKTGSEYIIKDVDTERNYITLTKNDKDVEINLSEFGSKLSSFNVLEKEFSEGDKIVFTKNDKKLNIKNGEIATITKLENDNLHYKKENGKEGVISLNNYNYFDYGYAITDYKSQGQTSKNVIVLADSQMANMNSFYVQATRAKENLKIFTDNKELLKKRAESEQVKTSTLDYTYPTQDKIIDKTFNKEKTNEVSKNKTSKSFTTTYEKETTKITEAEYQELTQKTKDELKLADPASVLSALNIDYKQNANRYIFKARADERTASANLYLDKNGEWKYKDFGSGSSGTIENLVMDVTSMNYKDALSFCIANTNTRDYLQERIDEIKNQKTIINKELSSDIKEKIEKRRELNIKKAKEHKTSSKVVNVTHLSQQAKEYLYSRNIYKIPPEFKQITGEYKNRNEEIKKAFGVGVLTKNENGADIHFFKKVGNLKTMSFGEKDISFFKKESSKDVAIFESKMDYAAAYQQIDFSKTDVIIANSTSNAHKVIDEIKDKYNQVHFFNQNDKVGEKFVKEIIDKANIKNYTLIEYKNDEEKLDINDLIKKDIDLSSRRYEIKEKEWDSSIVKDAKELNKIQQTQEFEQTLKIKR